MHLDEPVLPARVLERHVFVLAPDRSAVALVLDDELVIVGLYLNGTLAWMALEPGEA